MTENLEKVSLFNTLTRSVAELQPLNSPQVKIYCCGPTVYDFQHIGNMRTYIFEDFLVRMLRYAGYSVKHVMNITDVGHLTSDADDGEDKMIVAMRREGKSSLEIADFYTQQFFEDCTALHISRPDTVCKATDHVQEMIELSQRLETNGMTYQAGGNVYFDVSKLRDYGKLAKLDLEKLQAGARIEVDPNKLNPHDFVLWFTKSKFENQELQWDSPWGHGYPGWHIECSAMSIKYLGEQFDIHCGGIDHIPVHHTNEIAQSEGATGKPWVTIWMHGEFLVLNKERMAKSKGGFITLQSAIDRGFDPLSYRYLCMTAHYRKQLSFSWDALESAANSLKKLRQTVVALREEHDPESSAVVDQVNPHLEEFRKSMFSDLNIPSALAAMWNLLSDKELSANQKLSLLYEMDQILGFDLHNWKPQDVSIPEEILALVSERDAARTAKDWARSDALRDEITAHGYVVEDSPEGTKVNAK